MTQKEKAERPTGFDYELEKFLFQEVEVKCRDGQRIKGQLRGLSRTIDIYVVILMTPYEKILIINPLLIRRLRDPEGVKAEKKQKKVKK